MTKKLICGIAAVTLCISSGAVLAHGKAGANGLISTPNGDGTAPTSTGHENAGYSWNNRQPDVPGQNSHPNTDFSQDISKNPLTTSE